MNTGKQESKHSHFLTSEQVAEELNVGLPLVRALLKSGDLRGFQVGSRGIWRVSTKDLDDYIEHAYRLAAERVFAGEPAEDLARPSSAE